MKKLVLLLLFVLHFQIGFSQVGINTTAPNAQLEIRSSNQATPTYTDGILIPKIDAFPVVSPGSDQHAMMVYLTTPDLGKQPGFYYWNFVFSDWISFDQPDYDFIESGSSNAPDDINDSMYHSGDVGIGVYNPTVKLDVESSFDPSVIQARNIMPSEASYSTVYKSHISTVNQTNGTISGMDNYVAPNLNTKGYGIVNNFSGNTTDFIHGIKNNFNNSGSGLKYGFTNYFDAGTGSSYGLFNSFNQTSTVSLRGVYNAFNNTAGTGNIVGVENYFSGNGDGAALIGTNTTFSTTSNSNVIGMSSNITNANTGIGPKFGVYSLIEPTAGGTHYGIFSQALKISGYAGYFLGRVAIGSTAANNYILPLTRGTANQIMQTDGVGNVAWVNPTSVFTDTDNQTIDVLSLTGDTLNISLQDDALATLSLNLSSIDNQATDTFSLTGNTLNLSLQNDGVATQTVDLSSLSNDWKLTGNSGTVASTHFIGTIDDVDFVFKRNNIKSGIIGKFSTAFGDQALTSLTTGTHNVAFGSFALNSNTTGNSNTGLGKNALETNTIGSENTAVGRESLVYNIRGDDNVAVGRSSLASNTSGNNNVAIGSGALLLQAFDNVGVAYNTNNVAVGFESMYNNNPTSNSNGINNTAVGTYSLRTNIIGLRNVAVGINALFSNTNGNYNTAIGSYSYGSGNFSNSVAIGDAVAITASNQVRIGDGGVISIGGFANWTNVSDKRFKKDIQSNVPGLDFIKKLKPVTYHLDMEAIAREMKLPEELRKKDIEIEKGKILQTGFIAQEVELAAKEVGFDFSGIDAPKNNADFYGLRYAEFVVPLVKAVQEQQEIIDKQNTKIQSLEQRLQQLEEKLSK